MMSYACKSIYNMKYFLMKGKVLKKLCLRLWTKFI
jgi:hypothetical protein